VRKTRQREEVNNHLPLDTLATGLTKPKPNSKPPDLDTLGNMNIINLTKQTCVRLMYQKSFGNQKCEINKLFQANDYNQLTTCNER
jgi:hypothetical protein